MSGDDGRDGHEHDLVMPGFRFHPTEEELIEFYLRRKVEGKRFNVELINFLDLYRYDPWELPALAAIGEKEWFFYVPRDRKYRSGDRPNRVTTSGYWKATGADRTIRTENSRSIGLKKTLVFYSGKAPKGIRTSWIMNEYRLPQSETDRLQKAEISLCRVYKRSGVDDHRQLPDMPSSNPSSSKGPGSDRKRNTDSQQSSSFRKLGEKMERLPKIVGSNYMTGSTAFPLSHGQAIYSSTASVAPSSSATSTEDDCTPKHHLASSLVTPMATSSMATATIDELSRLVGYNPIYKHQPNQLHPLPPQPQLLLNAVSVSLPSVSEKLWEWNPLQEAWRDYTSFK